MSFKNIILFYLTCRVKGLSHRTIMARIEMFKEAEKYFL